MQAGGAQSSSFRKLLDYEQRVQLLAEESSEQQERATNCACVVFRLGDFKLAAPIESVQEILDVPAFSPVPGAKSWILGLSNVRGNLVTVCDVYWFLTGVRTPLTTRSRLVVADLQGKPLGLLVDEVYGQRHFHTDDARQTEQFEDTVIQPFVEMQFEGHGESWGIFNLDNLIKENQFMNGAA